MPPRVARPGQWPILEDPRRTRRNLQDRMAGWVVSAGGLATIISVLAILVFIAVEVAPLWSPPSAREHAVARLPDGMVAVVASVDEYREMLQVLDTAGTVHFIRLTDGIEQERFPFPTLGDEPIRAVAKPDGRHFVIATDRRILAARVDVTQTHGASGRELSPRVTPIGTWTLPDSISTPKLIGASLPDGGSFTAIVVDATNVATLISIRETEGFLGDMERSEAVHELQHDRAVITAVHVDARGTQAFLGTAAGRIERWDLREVAKPKQTDDVAAAFAENAAISALAPLIGNQSLVVGDTSGGVGVWFSVRDETGVAHLRRVHEFEPHQAPIRTLATSPRHRGFLSGDANGEIRLHHATTTQTLLSLQREDAVRTLVFAPKADGILALGDTSTISHWSVDNPHPEVSFKALFGKIWYEGYEEPAYVWQSTGGTDAFEPKLGLVPLMIGTMKGTIYALLFAVPLAVLGALYTSQFSHPRVRALVKPVVETMAALPSVVLGFLAGLWLAPLLETMVPAIIAALFVLPTLIFSTAVLWHSAPPRLRHKLARLPELIVLCALVFIGMQISLALNEPMERLFFGGDFQAWLQAAGWRFDQRNNIVVGFAMGFAVIPIIFTISEDAMSNVPQRLVSASLALGATRWQTALRIVLPTASPGIFSAAMIGFGRAVGETMIVLMATGNTPVLDLSIFTGMRTLSANIAVEIPEAPHGGTLYRVLFLAALLLFIVTFIVNTAAEIVRQRLRRRYQEL